MFANSVAALMIASILTVQAPAPDPQNAPISPQSSAPSAEHVAQTAAAKPITVPAGTAIPLTLMTVIKSKSTKPGDSIRAVIAFPVTVGTQLAIPAGTYVQGVVEKVTAKPLSNKAPMLSVRFTRLVFTNGYSAPISAVNSQALLAPQDTSGPANEVAELLPLQFPGQHFAMGEGQQTLPPLPQVGPSKGVVIGATVGGFAAFTIGMLVWVHRRANSYDYAVFDVGWQFQMVLDGPVTLNAAQVAAAAAMTPPIVN